MRVSRTSCRLQVVCGRRSPMSLVLYGHPFSSYTQKVLVALYENDTPFELRTLGPEAPEHMAEWQRRWPLRQFPLLVDGERNVVESSIIIEHEEAGQLTERVRRRPYSVLLLDEIDGARARPPDREGERGRPRARAGRRASGAWRCSRSAGPRRAPRRPRGATARASSAPPERPVVTPPRRDEARGTARARATYEAATPSSRWPRWERRAPTPRGPRASRPR